MTRPSPIATDVPFDADGVHHGHLVLPWSRDDSAWGTLRIPITVARRGEGPTVLVTGGNHGDEFEGPLAVAEWCARADAAALTGRVIALPYMNPPAVAAGRRLSPVDGGNMNRIFPGRPDGTVTEKIADYFQCVLLPMADVVLDFHSGGASLDFVPLAASHVLPDPGQDRRCAAARDAFGAPYTLGMVEIDAVGMYDTAAEEMGRTFVTTELGGAATSRPETVAIARRGLRNVLLHAGVIAGEPEPVPPAIHLTQAGGDCFHFAEAGGMVEFLVPLGDTVARGDVIARVWTLHATGVAPLEVTAKMDGLLMARHVRGLVQPGDCLAVLAVPEI